MELEWPGEEMKKRSEAMMLGKSVSISENPSEGERKSSSSSSAAAAEVEVGDLEVLRSRRGLP